MKLVALSMVRNEEYWIWYSLSSVVAHVDEILLFDNFSEDRTVEIVRDMPHIRHKLTLYTDFGGDSEHQNRQDMLAIARDRGATHALLLDGDEVHVDQNLAFCRHLLQVHEHTPALPLPPRNHGRAGDHTPTDGILLRHIGFKPVHPGFAGPLTCAVADLREPDTAHGCYNFAIRIVALDQLTGNGLEWGSHGFVEGDGIYVQSSPHTLWCPGLWYYHFTAHPRSSLRQAGSGSWIRPVRDLGSEPARALVHPPEALFRADGPGNPTLAHWGLCDARSEWAAGLAGVGAVAAPSTCG